MTRIFELPFGKFFDNDINITPSTYHEVYETLMLYANSTKEVCSGKKNVLIQEGNDVDLGSISSFMEFTGYIERNKDVRWTYVTEFVTDEDNGVFRVWISVDVHSDFKGMIDQINSIVSVSLVNDE